MDVSRRGRAIQASWLFLALCSLILPVLLHHAIAHAAEVPRLETPAGTAIQQLDLDGVVGAEWDDAQAYDMKLGKYWAEVLLKHDGEYLYIAMIVKTLRYFPNGFEGYIVFESGDGRDYSRGDDIISAFAEEGLLFEADYYMSPLIAHKVPLTLQVPATQKFQSCPLRYSQLRRDHLYPYE